MRKLILSLPLIAAATPAVAQQARPVAFMDEGKPVSLDRSDALLTKAISSAGRSKWGVARTYYRQSADVAIANDGFPVVALRGLANMHFFERRYSDAAQTLEELAGLSGKRGELVTQADALADAAWLYGLAGDRSHYVERIQELRALLQSAYMPETERTRIVRRLPAN